jgi:peroxiredoxin
MIDARSTTRGRLLLAAVFLACGFALPFGAAAAPDYTLIPKLQEIKDHPEAPDFTLPDAGGKKRSLKDYRGKVVFLAFWATWCPFCREEIPAMESVYKDYKGKGLEIVAVSIKDKREDTLAFVKKNKLTYPILMDPEGDIGSLYGAYATPTVYLIDRNGQVLARMWGPAGWGSPASRKLIAQLVEQK